MPHSPFQWKSPFRSVQRTIEWRIIEYLPSISVGHGIAIDGWTDGWMDGWTRQSRWRRWRQVEWLQYFCLQLILLLILLPTLSVVFTFGSIAITMTVLHYTIIVLERRRRLLRPRVNDEETIEQRCLVLSFLCVHEMKWNEMKWNEISPKKEWQTTTTTHTNYEYKLIIRVPKEWSTFGDAATNHDQSTTHILSTTVLYCTVLYYYYSTYRLSCKNVCVFEQSLATTRGVLVRWLWRLQLHYII